MFRKENEIKLSDKLTEIIDYLDLEDDVRDRLIQAIKNAKSKDEISSALKSHHVDVDWSDTFKGTFAEAVDQIAASDAAALIALNTAPGNVEAQSPPIETTSAEPQARAAAIERAHAAVQTFFTRYAEIDPTSQTFIDRKNQEPLRELLDLGEQVKQLKSEHKLEVLEVFRNSAKSQEFEQSLITLESIGQVIRTNERYAEQARAVISDFFKLYGDDDNRLTLNLQTMDPASADYRSTKETLKRLLALGEQVNELRIRHKLTDADVFPTSAKDRNFNEETKRKFESRFETAGQILKQMESIENSNKPAVEEKSKRKLFGKKKSKQKSAPVSSTPSTHARDNKKASQPAKQPVVSKSDAVRMNDLLDEEEQKPSFDPHVTKDLLRDVAPNNEKGKEEFVASDADRQLNEKTDRALELMRSVKALEKQLNKPLKHGITLNETTLREMIGRKNDISQAATALRTEVTALNNLDPKPDPRNHVNTLNMINTISGTCEELENVIHGKSHEFIEAEKNVVRNDWDRRLNNMEDYIRTWTAALNEPTLTIEEAANILARLNEQNDWGEHSPEGQALSARIDAIKRKLPDDPDLQALDRRDIAISEARRVAMELAQSKLDALNALDVPPPPPPPRDDEDEELIEDNYFFAKTEAEYRERLDQVRDTHNDFSNMLKRAERAEVVASTVLKTSIVPAAKVNEVIANIDAQVRSMKLYKGFLEDIVRRFDDEHTDVDGTPRDPAWEAIPPAGNRADAQNRIDDIQTSIDNLVAAKTAIIQHRRDLEANPAPQNIAYYAKENAGNPYTANNKNEAAAYAYEYLRMHDAKPLRTPAPTVLNGHGDSYAFTTPDCEFRTTCTKIATKNMFGTPEKLPAAIVQSINAEKTYSRQELIISKADLAKLDKLPFSAEEKLIKRKEQLEFIATMIESAMAAISTNGPVTLDYFPTNLQSAAAVYCEKMGYELHPKTIQNNLSAKEKAAYTAAFDQLSSGATANAKFTKMLDAANDRIAVKKGRIPEGPRP